MLDTLQSFDRGGRESSQERAAVVEAGDDERLDQELVIEHSPLDHVEFMSFSIDDALCAERDEANGQGFLSNYIYNVSSFKIPFTINTEIYFNQFDVITEDI